MPCEYDEDCPEDKVCEESKCITLDELENEDLDADIETLDDEDSVQGPRSCTSAEDCGCGYECKYDECRKLESSCNVDGDCNTGDFCDIGYGQICGTCVKSECKTDSDCGNPCSNHCSRNRCLQYGCCSNSDCGMDSFCQKSDGEAGGSCRQIECYNDSDCGCGFICDQDTKECLNRSEDRPIPCCDGYFYYKDTGYCVPRDLIEDGSCLDDSHCTKDQICSEGEHESRCLPAKCTKNTDCGYEAGCWEGHCELGCNEDSACQDKDYPTCKHGECVNLNPEEDEE